MQPSEPIPAKINIGDNCFPRNGECAHWGFIIYKDGSQSDSVHLTPKQWNQQYEETNLPAPERIGCYDSWDALIDQGYRVEITKKTIKWYKNDKLHRDVDLPAIESLNGTKMWYCDGLLHREGDLPAVKNPYGIKEWRQRGVLHRDGDLPALVEHGSKWWYKHGKKHREGNLPAKEGFYGDREWWTDGFQIRTEEATKAWEKFSRTVYGGF